MDPVTELTIDADGGLTNVSDGRRVRLTSKEAALCVALSGRRGGLVTKGGMLTELYQGLDEPAIKIVDVFVCKARRKLAEVGAGDAIDTVWGQGYRWSTSVTLEATDRGHVSMEVTPEMNKRLEDLALATDRSVGQVLQAMVEESIEQHERRAWE